MFTINHNQELTPELLYKMIQRFNTAVKPTLEKRKRYYDGVHDILLKTYTDKSKPCAHVITNFCFNIADCYTGYLAAPGFISYTSNEYDITQIMDVLNYNDVQDEDAELLLNALIYGVGSELMYIDRDGKVRFKTIAPTQSFGIFDDSLTNDLMYFVRFYKTNDWDDGDEYTVDVYSDNTIQTYKMLGIGGSLQWQGSQPHFFKQCPANIMLMPDEKGIFDCIISLQDAYNEIQSSEIDDFSAFVDAFLTIEGADADGEDIARMKEERVLLLPEGASASWLTKNANDAQVENILDRLQAAIYRIAQCPDFSSESFVGGVASGIALRFRLCGMENRAAKIAATMKKALLRRCEIIAGIATLLVGDEIVSDIEIIMKRNIPQDDAAIAQTVNAYRGLVTDKTLLSMIPQVTDPEAEIVEMKEQKAEQMSLYSFGDSDE